MMFIGVSSVESFIEHRLRIVIPFCYLAIHAIAVHAIFDECFFSRAFDSFF